METLASAILVLAILAVLIYGIIPALKGGISGAQLQQCMKTQDMDGDGRLIDDTCMCDPGNLQEQDSFYLKAHPECVLVPLYDNVKADLKQYVYGDVKDVEKCHGYAIKLAEDIFINDGNGVCGNTEENIKTTLAQAMRGNTVNNAAGKGIVESCAKAIAQKKPSSNDPLIVCPTSATACEQRFRTSPLCKPE